MNLFWPYSLAAVAHSPVVEEIEIYVAAPESKEGILTSEYFALVAFLLGASFATGQQAAWHLGVVVAAGHPLNSRTDQGLLVAVEIARVWAALVGRSHMVKEAAAADEEIADQAHHLLEGGDPCALAAEAGCHDILVPSLCVAFHTVDL